ncbi:MAG: L-serine ammonia-lyase, iron-sulfur-dependent, subunit beta, partial [Atopobiaceae bacterium]
VTSDQQGDAPSTSAADTASTPVTPSQVAAASTSAADTAQQPNPTLLHQVFGGVFSKAATYAMAVLETNASMGRIVAAPTAGSAGVLPGVIMALDEVGHFSDTQLQEALANAAAIGYIVTRNATVAGAEGGCQAEMGTASAMAASAATQLLGGSPQQCLAAAAIAITNMLGLVCDPVGGLVEEPCQKRNASAATNALVSAQMALAGIHSTAFFDETVDAMSRVGRSLPFELRETALGGIATCASCLNHCKKGSHRRS